MNSGISVFERFVDFRQSSLSNEGIPMIAINKLSQILNDTRRESL